LNHAPSASSGICGTLIVEIQSKGLNPNISMSLIFPKAQLKPLKSTKTKEEMNSVLSTVLSSYEEFVLNR